MKLSTCNYLLISLASAQLKARPHYSCDVLYGTSIEGIYFYATNEAKYPFLKASNGFQIKKFVGVGLMSFLSLFEHAQHKAHTAFWWLAHQQRATVQHHQPPQQLVSLLIDWFITSMCIVALDGRNRNGNRGYRRRKWRAASSSSMSTAAILSL